MSRVMLVCPEPLGHGRPAGIGVRFIEMARVLRADGHDVTVISPDAGAIEGTRAAGLDAQTLASVSQESDVAVLQGHVANAFFVHAKPVPAVVDLYDPYIIENFNYYPERGAEVFRHDHLTLMTSLLRGDYFLCASDAQRMFYLGMLVATGRLNPVLFQNDPRAETLLARAPFGVRPPRSAPPRRGNDILFGGVYDWYDPVAAIDAVAIARRTIPDVTLTFTSHPNPELTPQGKLASAVEHAKRHGYDFIRFEPWAPYEQRAAYFDRFAMALLTSRRSLETDLAMRTRIYDYLWCNLPIVTSSTPGTDEFVIRYGAGSVIQSEEPDEFANAIVAILSDGATYDGMVAGAQQFVREHQWDRTLAPLRAFVREPRFEKTKDEFAAGPQIAERRPTLVDRIKGRLRRLA